MIIRIEGLPEGQIIKHINVDITFDDVGTPITKVISEPVDKKFYAHDVPIVDRPVPPPSTFRKESEKPIPPEMTNIEF